MLLDPAQALRAIDALALLLLATGLASTLLHRLGSFVGLLAVQGLLLAGAAGAVALVSGELHAYAALVVTLAVKVTGVPALLAFALRRLPRHRDAQAVISHKSAFVLAVGLVLLAYLVTGPIARADALTTPNALPVAVALLLIGLLTMATRAAALTQVVGLVMSENGIYLAAVAVTRGLPLAVELGVGVDILVGVLVMGLVVRHIERTFATINTERLTALRG